jgi:hypothetical protein
MRWLLLELLDLGGSRLRRLGMTAETAVESGIGEVRDAGLEWVLRMHLPLGGFVWLVFGVR